MNKTVKLFFNFRSPYCYLASKTLWPIFDDFYTQLDWRPVGGWDLRSPPERAKLKVPLTRQDVARWARSLGVPLNPPPIDTDPTLAAAGSVLANKRGLLHSYIVEVMHSEWAEGKDIGEAEVLLDVADRIGLKRDELQAAFTDQKNHDQLTANAHEAASLGVMGVPSFVIDRDIFWGQDRIDFVLDHLRELRLARYE